MKNDKSVSVTLPSSNINKGKSKKEMIYKGTTYKIESGIISSPTIIKNFEMLMDEQYETVDEFFYLLKEGIGAAIGNQESEKLINQINDEYEFEDGLLEILFFFLGCYCITKGLSQEQMQEFFRLMVEQLPNFTK